MRIPASHPALAGHFPGHPVVPGVVMLATVSGVMGIVALLLASMGIYGVTAYIANQRTREVGIRMALGAQRGDVSRLFVRQGVVLTGSLDGETFLDWIVETDESNELLKKLSEIPAALRIRHPSVAARALVFQLKETLK